MSGGESLAPLLAASVVQVRNRKAREAMAATTTPGFSHAELVEEQRHSAALAKVEPRPIETRHAASVTFNEDQVRTIRQTVAKDCTDVEFAFFLEVARRSQLDPFRKQIYAIKRMNRKTGVPTMAIQTGIDGFRLIASRTGLYEGQEPTQWCGSDGKWTDVWLAKGPPAAARVGVMRKGFKEPLRAVAKFDSYKQDTPLWANLPEVMIAKVAEALALRKAFPEDLSGLYSDDEMAQADRKPEPAPVESPSELDALEARGTEAIGVANTLDELKAIWTDLCEQTKAAKMGAKQFRRLREAKDARKARLEAEAKGDAELEAMGTNDAYGLGEPAPAKPTATCLLCKEPVGDDGEDFVDSEDIVRRKHKACTAFGRGV